MGTFWGRRMSDEYKEKLSEQYKQLSTTTAEVEKLIDLLKHSSTLDFNTLAKTTAFLEGYMTGLNEQSEWLEWIISKLGGENDE